MQLDLVEDSFDLVHYVRNDFDIVRIDSWEAELLTYCGIHLLLFISGLLLRTQYAHLKLNLSTLICLTPEKTKEKNIIPYFVERTYQYQCIHCPVSTFYIHKDHAHAHANTHIHVFS